MFSHFLQKSDVTEHKLASGFRRRSISRGEGRVRLHVGHFFWTYVHSDWPTNFGKTSDKFKVYLYCRYIYGNQIDQLPFGVFVIDVKVEVTAKKELAGCNSQLLKERKEF